MSKQTQPASVTGAEHPLRLARRRRGMTTTALADLAGLSQSFLSMVETGQRTLSRRDHINALAAALRVPPAEIAPSMSPGFDEWAPVSSRPAPAFPAVRDEVTVTRHARLAREFVAHLSGGDTHAAGRWLRRIARDPSVSPWLVLDQLTAPQNGLRTGSAVDLASASKGITSAGPTLEGARTG